MADGNQHDAELERRVQRRVDVLNDMDELKEDLVDYKAEDKADGFTEKAIMQVVKERRKGPDYQVAQHTLEAEVDTYRKACGEPTNLQEAHDKAAKTVRETPEPKRASRKAKQEAGKPWKN